MAGFDPGDEEWAAIEPLLPGKGRGPAREDDRTVLNGLFYILRTGAPWRGPPERYGPRTTVFNRYVRRGERGIWQGIFEAPATECDDALVFVDNSYRQGAPRGKRRKRGSFAKVLDAHAAVAAVKFTPPQNVRGALCGSTAHKPMMAKGV